MGHRNPRPTDMSARDLRVSRLDPATALAAARTVADQVVRADPAFPRAWQREQVRELLAMLGIELSRNAREGTGDQVG